MNKAFEFQLRQVDELNKSQEYQDASIYTVLLDLVMCNNDVDEIKHLLDMAAKDYERYRNR